MNNIFSDSLILVDLFISAIVGTSVMTLFLYMTSWITKNNFRVIHILGNMLTFKTKEDGSLSNSFWVFGVGSVIHYMVGFLYVVAYHFLLMNGHIRLTLFQGIIVGIVTGIVAVGGWKCFYKLHPKPPIIKLKLYLWVILLAHILFSIVVLYTYLFLFRYPLPMDQSLN